MKKIGRDSELSYVLSKVFKYINDGEIVRVVIQNFMTKVKGYFDSTLREYSGLLNPLAEFYPYIFLDEVVSYQDINEGNEFYFGLNYCNKDPREYISSSHILTWVSEDYSLRHKLVVERFEIFKDSSVPTLELTEWFLKIIENSECPDDLLETMLKHFFRIMYAHSFSSQPILIQELSDHESSRINSWAKLALSRYEAYKSESKDSNDHGQQMLTFE